MATQKPTEIITTDIGSYEVETDTPEQMRIAALEFEIYGYQEQVRILSNALDNKCEEVQQWKTLVEEMAKKAVNLEKMTLQMQTMINALDARING